MLPSHQENANESLLWAAVLGAVGRLLSVITPSRKSTTTHRLADSSKVDHSASLDITLVVGAYTGRSVGWYTPGRHLGAGGMYATPL